MSDDDTRTAGSIAELIESGRLVPIAEAAARLGTTYRTLRRRELERKLTIVREGGRAYMTGAETERYLGGLVETAEARDGRPESRPTGKRRRAS